MTNTLETKEAAAGTSARHVGHYVLQRELGRGGMSVVYEALDMRTGQPVALKLLRLPPTLDAAETDVLIARFEREARTVARLSHPNVIGIHEIGAVEGQHFLAMEFLRGQTLRQRLTQSRLTVRDACSILTQIAGALDMVHAAGIVHRDVKASNIMLLPDGTAKLLDFGIARSREEAEITTAGAILGTPSYMAPEQVRGEPATPATDLWSLGVLSYEMLTGHLPFAGQVVANVLYQVLNSSPAPMLALPKSVQKVLRRALDKDPALRYPSAAVLAEVLGSALPKSVPPKSVPPKSVLSEPTAPEPSVKQRTAPRWAVGAVLLLLFLSAFSAASLHRGPAPVKPRFVIAVTPPPSAQVIPPPAASPAQVIPPPAAPPAPMMLLPVPLVAARNADTQTENKQSGILLPRPREPVHIHERNSNASPDPGPAAPGVETSTEAKRVPEPRFVRAAKPSAIPAKQSAVRPAQAPDTLQAQATEQTQAAVQSVALPAGGDTDNPEADARLRKSAWSQQDNSSVAP